MNLTDEQLVATVGSRDETESYEAAKEIMRRGEQLIPLLVANKGNRQPYAWGSLGKPSTSEITFSPSSDEGWDEGRIITVEVASLYLISALYHGRLDFAHSAYLKDNSPVEFNKYNTPERVEKAWASAEKWLRHLQKEGIASLRAKKRDPLAQSGFYF